MSMVPMNPEINPDHAWTLVQNRNPQADGQLFYGVRSTRIFCRPSCPSRRPARSNVEFFSDLMQALRAGYHPCKRCSPAGIAPEAQIVQTLCDHLNRTLDRQVKLAELAHIVNLSPFTVQRLFRRVLGISPSQYQSQLRASAFRKTISNSGARITDAIYEAGYSSSSRAYSVQPPGMQPREYRNRGRDQTIGYATGPCVLGHLLIAATEKGLCAVLMADSKRDAEAELHRMFPKADLGPKPELAPMLEQVLSQLTEHPAALDIPLDLRATAFQMRVWQALRKIPRGKTLSYAQLAQKIGKPTATRAVARACGTNPASVVIPCHRILGSDSSLTGYRWGLERKRKLLDIEKAASK
ncbi:MAG TPA: bifunctional DNA-binding transcriptional regulator/O6-methylguanine-DNA methyltransferase Ada [Candidatus Angelobacter sp.]|nr:bifunctional DNA-binding transcriptional regulator/O6-methylguanine-DNA methyltransferase Ada [Candidatus Angelobacter sp.]